MIYRPRAPIVEDARPRRPPRSSARSSRSRSTAARIRSPPGAWCWVARASATSGSPTRTCRGGTPRCARKGDALGGRPRLDERDGGERAPRRADEALRRRSDHDRLHGRRLRALASVTDAIDVDEALLALKIAFLVLLYLFIWLIVRSATKDLKVAPQESIVLGAEEAAQLRAQLAPQAGPPDGSRQPGAAAWATVEIANRHARRPRRRERHPAGGRRLRLEPARAVRPRTDGLWVEDVGSTNGTYVNGARGDERAPAPLR